MSYLGDLVYFIVVGTMDYQILLTTTLDPEVQKHG